MMKKYTKFLSTGSGQIIGFTALLFISLLAYYFYKIAHTPLQSDLTTVPSLTQEDHTRGAKDAKVTIIEYGDFECPACKAYESVVRDLQAKHKDDIRLTFREFPLITIHKNAFMSASYAESASLQGKFWEMHDILYDKQEEWGESLDAEQKIKVYASEIGLDVAKLSNDAQSEAVKNKIIADYKEAGILKLPGTPSFFVNGVKIDSKDLVTKVEDLLKK
jgi:protein-disulfide isomerase